eukprot:GFYU01005024.1.p1 GENE.GFYU01005024.1~~GFYU01005024.1.p1  ORF type:complete len:110 (-),score=31.50 GFYU01005024.1:97-426(-)
MSVQSTGKVVQQHKQVKVHSCHRCWLVGHCCHDEMKTQNRGLTAGEMNTVLQALRAKAYAAMQQSFKTAPKMLAAPEAETQTQTVAPETIALRAAIRGRPVDTVAVDVE